MKHSALLLGLALVLSACGSSDDKPLRSAGNRGPLPEQATPYVEKIHASNRQDPCEVPLQAIQLEIARELDRRRPEMQPRPVSYEKYKEAKKVGPAVILMPHQLFDDSGPDWREFKHGWKDLIKFYQAIQGTPTDEHWTRLDLFFRGQLVDDYARTVGEANYALDKTSPVWVPELYSVLEKCVENSSCADSSFSSEQKRRFESTPVYRSAWSSRDFKQLKEILEDDYKSIGFEKDHTVKRVSEKQIELTINPRIFAGAEAELVDLVESVWKSSELSVKLKFESAGDLYQMLFHDGVGGRSFVRRSNRSVNLYSHIHAKVVAHEFGHVLGFSDHYYDIWSPEDCGYIEQVSYRDIMSNHETGRVTAEEWDTLRKQYPLR